jgi:hypothetical protein
VRGAAFVDAPSRAAYRTVTITLRGPMRRPEDMATTAHIVRAAKVSCMPVLDHLIVTRNPQRYHSMFERGTLPVIEE